MCIFYLFSFIFHLAFLSRFGDAVSFFRSASRGARVGDQPPPGTLLYHKLLQGSFFHTTLRSRGVPGTAVQVGLRSPGVGFCFLFCIFFWVSGRFGGEASRPPDSVSRGRWLGVRGWWRVWCSGRQALLSPGVMRPCRVASDGYIFFGCGLSTIVFFVSGGFGVFAFGFSLFYRLQLRSIQWRSTF